jgi:hypothetical protein
MRRLGFVLVTLLSVAASVHPTRAQSEGTSLEIVVSRQGLDGRSDSAYAVRVGEPVRLTFVYGDTGLASDNPHRMAVLGLDVPEVTVSRETPRATIEFTPEEPGEFRLVCTIACAGMENLVGGSLRVNPPAVAGQAADVRLELIPQPGGASVVARAELLDPSGLPMTDAPLVFARHTAVGGELALGTVWTSVEGIAELEVPTVPGATVSLGVLSEGGVLHADAEIVMAGTMAGMHPESPLSTRTAPPVLAVLLLIVVGGVWGTYGAVAYQLVRIRREKI